MKTLHLGALAVFGLLALVDARSSCWAADRIDRHALVTRHSVTLTNAAPLTPLSVGNGEFAFTADITGLQTFPAFHEKGMPLHTMSQWGWHSFPNPEKFRSEDALSLYDSHGRQVPYLDGKGTLLNATNAARAKAANAWLRANPHRIDLGRLGLVLRKRDGSDAKLADLTGTRQTLDLWRGCITSEFTFDGQPVRVETVCHPKRDLVAVQVESPLVASGRLGARLAFPYAAGDWQKAADWQKPERHQTILHRAGNEGCTFDRVLDADRYGAAAKWSPGADLKQLGPHEFAWTGTNRNEMEIVLAFSPSVDGRPLTPPSPAVRERVPVRAGEGDSGVSRSPNAPTALSDLPTFAETKSAAAAHWEKFWTAGGAIDLSGSTDPRWRELERRIVLSQYLTAINCAGSMPPQETGLVCDSWYGKPHLEMHWWHAAQFALWDRVALLEKSLPWYERILPMARATAERQGYRGARWPKMTGPDGRSSPSEIGEFLIWQQPHPIFYAELAYRGRPTHETLERYRQIVFDTAEFMASYAWWDVATKRFVLGPPLIPAQESYGPQRQRVINPTFELAYWHWALDSAQQWRERLGLPREPKWDKVRNGLARPTVRDGVYAAIEVAPYTITNDHPSMVAALGLLPPTPLTDAATMRRTLDHVFQVWNWPGTWGWDYPMLAMTAARVGEPDKAIDALLIDTPKNRYLANGHNYQRDNLPLYLPGNGGLLYAVAMMAAGWDGAPKKNAPGFPDNGKWRVKWEGLKPAP